MQLKNCILKCYIFIIIAIFPVLSGLDKDPYAILGLKRGSSVADVKKAYKQLAKEWHPDKNDSPEAEARFVEISQAYELLSDAKKKEQYDNYGTFDSDPWENAARSHGAQFFHHGFFEEFGFRMPEPSRIFQKHSINMRQFEQQILPESHHKPCLLFAYSDWCSGCKAAEPMWEKIVSDIEPIGYCVGTVNNVYQGALLRRMQVRHMPSLSVVVEGRVLHYKGDFSPSQIIKFAKAVIPQHIVQPIDDHNYEYFLNSWQLNKVPVLMFGSLDQPRLRYMLMAYDSYMYGTFGYVQLQKNDAELRRVFGIKPNNTETLMIFNERGASPVATLSQRGELSSEAMRNAVLEHKFLILPRVSSQRHFDELCPPESKLVGVRRHLCVILLVRKVHHIQSLLGNDADDVHVAAFRDFVERQFQTAPSSERGRVRFAYMYANVQQRFLNALQPSDERANASYRDVIIVRRLDQHQSKYQYVRGGWSGEAPLVNRCAEALLGDVQRYMSRVDLLDKSILIHEELHNEHGPNWYKRLAFKTMRAYENFLFYMEKEELYPILSVFGTLGALLLLSLCFNFLSKTEERERTHAKTTSSARSVPIEKTMEFNTLCHELRAETYFGMVRLQKPGCRTVVVICDQQSKDKLLPRFTRAIWPWRKNVTLTFGFLMIDKNLAWYRSLMSDTLDLSNPMQINPRNVVGTVLILNGFRRYFQLFHACHEPSVRAARSRRLKRSSGGAFIGMDDADEVSSSSDSAAEDYEAGHRPLTSKEAPKALLLEELLDALPSWLERVFEGTVKRYYIAEWPTNIR